MGWERIKTGSLNQHPGANRYQQESLLLRASHRSMIAVSAGCSQAPALSRVSFYAWQLGIAPNLKNNLV
jgi:hypothetical protein